MLLWNNRRKRTFAGLLAIACGALVAHAQDPLDLTVTLPNGKVVTFATPEQKARFEAARQRAQSSAATPAPSPAAAASGSKPTAAKPAVKIGSSLDPAPNSGSGQGNPSAPMFTANYYLAAPASWLDKIVVLSVAYVEPRNEVRPDGMVQLNASTWNYSTSGAYWAQDLGGYLPILASPEAALKLQRLCGSSLHWNGAGVRTTMIKGKFSRRSLLANPAEQRYLIVLED